MGEGLSDSDHLTHTNDPADRPTSIATDKSATESAGDIAED